MTWVNHKLKGDIPTKRHGHTINLIENKLILFGGITEEGYSDEIFLIDLITFQCQK